MKTRKKAFTLIEIMAASAIMTIIVLGVLSITVNVLKTWNRASGQLQTYFDAGVVADIIQEDLESLKIKRDGRAWLQVAYPETVGALTGESDMDTVPMRPPQIMFYAPTLLRPRYTRDNIASAQKDAAHTAQIPGSVCAIKYQLALKSPFMESSVNPGDNESQYNAFYGFYRAVIDPKSTAMECMGETVQGYNPDPTSEDFKLALQNNVWSKTCTVIDEEGQEQAGQDLRSWALAPENLLSMNVVDLRVTFAVMYKDPDYQGGVDESPYKVAYIPPGKPLTVGKMILADEAYEIGQSGSRESVDVTSPEFRSGTLTYADVSMTCISDEGAKLMRAQMKQGTLSQDRFKELVLEYGNTVVRRIQFIAEPVE